MGLDDAFEESRVGCGLRTLRRWAATSTLVSVLEDERVLLAALGAFGLASVVFVFSSNLGAGVQFLSFLLLFVVIAALTERFVDPPAE